jgi:phage terminase large subunit GpA-like protein
MADWRREKGDRVGADWTIRWNKARRQKEIIFGTNFWKSLVASRLGLPAGSPGSLSFYGERPNLHELIANHLTAEMAVRVSTGERTVDEWQLKPGRDNDLFDTVVGCYVAASVRGVSTDASAGTAMAAKPKRVSMADLQRAAKARRVAH